jgi:hypothetical protein
MVPSSVPDPFEGRFDILLMRNGPGSWKRSIEKRI